MKETLIIMGSHPKTLKFFDWSRTDCDIWLFNEAATGKNEKGESKYPRCDAIFQMHHEAIWRNPKNRSDSNHYKWLSSGKTPTVYMQEAYPDIPKSVRYPIEDVLSLVNNVGMVVNGHGEQFKYFTSSPDYALALVAYNWKKGKRYKRVEIVGIELETESEVYFSQRTGFGFWLGYLTALGIPLVYNGSIFNEPMYGYEGDVAISSKDIEKRISDLKQELGDDSEKYQKEAKVFLESVSGLLTQNIGPEIEKQLNEIIKKNERAAILNGKIKESERYLEKARAMEEASGASVFAAGEFDGTRQAYGKQQLQLQLETVNFNTHIAAQMRKLLEFEVGSEERRIAVDEFGQMMAEFMNKNMVLFHAVGAMQENQYYLDSCRQSVRLTKKRK